MKEQVSVCWLRRDLRLFDNAALYHALMSGHPVLLIFIFDTLILEKLPDKNDRRVSFIHQSLRNLQEALRERGSSLLILHGEPPACFEKLCSRFDVKNVFTNHDYEPYAIDRDAKIGSMLAGQAIPFRTFKDQVIFERSEVMKPDGSPYTVFTPYSRIWKQKYRSEPTPEFPSEEHLDALLKTALFPFPSLAELGFEKAEVHTGSPEINEEILRHYHDTRNIPSVDGTSKLSVHLRFGTVSVRRLVRLAAELNEQWLNELIWRDFFMMILFQFPEVVAGCFKKKYEQIRWRNNEHEFELWCKGETGYPIVDAGMRQLNETGWMHNRVRMIVASFLVKHLLIDWRWGEAYFAEKLLDYELASNNGNWQWAAGCGCDAAPYFRIFNPHEQTRKFDPELKYIKTWIKGFPDYYPEPIVEHDAARKRALQVYKESLGAL
ncbi:deoxyribodipyrimidine photo-lyase [Flavihumibacter sp. R14]|nr:deoxyribodipyrimidine photo-lyase [Flavihumibacter soli]